MGRDYYDDDYSSILGKRIENLSFYYPLLCIWSENPGIKKTAKILGILFILGIVFFIYPIMDGQLVVGNDPFILLFAVGILLLLLGPISIIFVLLDKCKFKAGIYEKGIEIGGDCHTYEELKEVKLYQYLKNGSEYIKFIYTKYDDRIITRNFLWNHKMEEFLDRIQESFQNNGVNCEKITDIKGIDIKEPVEYKEQFRFISMLRLLGCNEIFHRIRKALLLYGIILLVFSGIFFSGGNDDSHSSNASGKGFLIIAGIILTIFIVHFILSIKKFYARIENNTVYIHNGYGGNFLSLSDNYILSKIKANYGIIAEGNVEGIALTIDNGEKTTIYKRPKNEKVERFCNDLLSEIRKHKEL